MVKRASWRKFRELKAGRYRVVLYRERSNASIFKLEIIDQLSGSYCGEVYAYFNDELVIMNNVSALTVDDLLKIASMIEDYLQRIRET
ncbi:MAG: hypothetical protein GXO26_02705 [Crenarchaeota archaeon]|nr:hypothetical protein [Thermoproteota archaeon]